MLKRDSARVWQSHIAAKFGGARSVVYQQARIQSARNETEREREGAGRVGVPMHAHIQTSPRGRKQEEPEIDRERTIQQGNSSDVATRERRRPRSHTLNLNNLNSKLHHVGRNCDDYGT